MEAFNTGIFKLGPDATQEDAAQRALDLMRDHGEGWSWERLYIEELPPETGTETRYSHGLFARYEFPDYPCIKATRWRVMFSRGTPTRPQRTGVPDDLEAGWSQTGPQLLAGSKQEVIPVLNKKEDQ